MTADTYRQAIRAIDAALTAEERALIEERHGVAAWSGAPFDDILAGLIAHDAYCYRTDPFFAEHRGWIPVGPLPAPDGGPTVRLYAAYALLAAGADLTVDAVTGLMARAGLCASPDEDREFDARTILTRHGIALEFGRPFTLDQIEALAEVVKTWEA